ncbi:MAG: DUF2304 domain-containing protein [Candidatus Velthaea sp.]
MIVSLLILALLLIVIYVASHRIGGLALAGVLATFAVGVALVISPDLANRLARTLNVGRGTDLILYIAVVGGVFVAANLYFRWKRHEDTMVRIVRELALTGAARSAAEKTASAAESAQTPE